VHHLVGEKVDDFCPVPTLISFKFGQDHIAYNYATKVKLAVRHVNKCTNGNVGWDSLGSGLTAVIGDAFGQKVHLLEIFQLQHIEFRWVDNVGDHDWLI
jgi:hypothetical protein